MGYCGGLAMFAYNRGAVSGSQCGGVVGRLDVNEHMNGHGALYSAYNAGPAATGFGGVIGVYSADPATLPDHLQECYFDEAMASAVQTGDHLKGKQAFEMQTSAFAEELNGSRGVGAAGDERGGYLLVSERGAERRLPLV